VSGDASPIWPSSTGCQTIYAQRDVRRGGRIVIYGSNLRQLFLRAAIYVDKILRGSRPAVPSDQQAHTSNLAIILRTAKVLG
jgi:putative ABC transport system substrate-binding protein